MSGDLSDWDASLESWLDELKCGGLTRMTREASRSALGIFFSWLLTNTPTVDLRQVAEEDVKRFALSLLERRLADATRLSYLSALRRFFRFLLDRGDLLLDPTERLPLPKVRSSLVRQALSREEMSRLLNASRRVFQPCRARALIEILYSAGLRRSECARLSIYDLDLDGGLCFVRNGKGRKDRIVPLGKPACEALRRYISQREQLVRDASGAALWLSASRPRRGRPMGGAQLWKILREVFGKAEILRPMTLHTMRHTAATHLLRGGADIRVVQEFLGHASLATTARYTHLGLPDLKEAHRRAFPR